MKKNLVLFFTVTAMFAGGCKKDSKTNQTINSTADSYFPLTSGSTWQYLVTGINGTDTLTVKMNGASTTISRKTYYKTTCVYQKTGSSTGYFFDASHIYGTGASNTSADLTVEFQFLNDTAAVEHSWISLPTDEGKVNGVPARAITTIAEKDIGKTIGGEIFTGVIHTRVDLQYNYGNGFKSAVVYDYYFAKGVGMIEKTTRISGSVYETETLASYAINPMFL